VSRLDTIRQRAAEHGADAAILTHPATLRWAVGFTGSNGLLVVGPTEAHFVTDGRYTTQAATEVEGAEVHVAPSGLAEFAAEAGWLDGVRSAVVASDHTTVAAMDVLRKAFGALGLVPVKEFLVADVAAKSEAEIAAVASAQALTCGVFSAILPYVQPGVSELDLAAEIVYQHLKRGASAMSFEPIVAAGPRGALPHARPSTRTLAPGDLVVIDMGCVLDGYCSDLTRTVAVSHVDDGDRAAYEVVREAQAAAIDAARAGLTGRQLDAVARDVIEAAGLGEYFTHSLGHGVGLEIHEWPRLSQQVEHALPVGATVTIEPGVYLPERFGVRIENVVVLREDGCEDLTPLPSDLLVV